MTIHDFKDKKITVMGLGSYAQGSGIAAALFFAKAGAQVTVTDMKPKEALAAAVKKLEKYQNIAFALGGHSEKDFTGADMIIKNPDVPMHSPYLALARNSGVPIHNDWSIFASLKQNMWIGVTGTRGKTTTTTLIDALVKTQYPTRLCGNVGVSPLAVYHAVKKNDIIVSELSSWNLQQLGAARRSPHIAVLTNLLRDHMNKYKTIGEYYKDKENIFTYQTKDDVLVANRDNDEVRKRVKKARARIVWFSHMPFAGDGAYIKNNAIYFTENKKTTRVCAVGDIRLKGEHNHGNVLAAICVAMTLGITPARIKSGVRKFSGVAHRLEHIATVKGVHYYDDTTATTPDATIAALTALPAKNMILLAGGTDKKLEFRALAETLAKRKPRLILFAGTATDKLQKELRKTKYDKTIGIAHSMQEAMEMVRTHAKRGDVVLLSPGAASFGIFKNEFDRGDQFRACVKKLR